MKYPQIPLSKILVTVTVLAAMTGVIYLMKALVKAPVPPNVESGPEARPKAAAKAMGNPSARVYIVEYSDFQCPACTYASKALKGVYEEHAAQMYIEFRHYPIPKLHPYAVTAAVFAECASRQGRFWPYHDLLFERNRQWSRGLNVREHLTQIAGEVGVELNAFKACVEDKSVEMKVLLEKSEGARRGVHATPSYFINGQMVVGAKSLQEKLNELFSEAEP